MKRRLSGRRSQRQSEQLWATAYILVGLRFTPAMAAQLFRGVVYMEEASTYQAILEEGRAEGMAQGTSAAARKTLAPSCARKFGTPDAVTAAAIERIAAVEQLEELCERLEFAANWQDLLGSTKAGTQKPRRQPTP